MKSLILACIVATAAAPATAAGDNADFQRQLVRSGYVHTPLPLDREHSLDAKAERKTVISERIVDVPPITLRHATSTGMRAKGSPDDPDYALYGHCVGRFDIGGRSWEDYNRIAFDITPHCDGARVVNLTLNFVNDHRRKPKPGYNAPTGAHQIHLVNGQTNHCYLEIADLQRDAVQELTFSVSLNGRDITTGDSALYVIDNLRLQLIDDPEPVSGWEPRPGAIIHSMTGYDARGEKRAVVSSRMAAEQATFELVDTLGRVVYSGPVEPVTTTIGSFGVIDFTPYTAPGQYSLRVGDVSTPAFGIGGHEIWEHSNWLLLNYIFGQRCGYHVNGIHGRCHSDLFAVHNGVRIPYSGGWHDAGDLSQQTLQTADVAHALLEAAAKAEDQGNEILAARLREEAMWGIDFVLRSRFGDGYRASSMGLLIWQDGFTDSFDDINTVRVQDVTFDNYLHAGYGAYAAMHMAQTDPQLSRYLAKVAVEDFGHADRKYAESGFGGFISPYEHSYNTSMSQFMATRSWAASQLYSLTGDKKYADLAAQYIQYVLDCQQTEPVGGDAALSGFFYRDDSRKQIVHYIHQSREQIYMQALDALCATQPEHPDYGRWHAAVQRYGQYLKALMAYVAPYGMVPAGVYRDDEYLDTDGFYAVHLFPPANAAELYHEQIAAGVKVDDHHYVKRFPVWFNIFNGNLAVHTSVGKSAAICARMLGDDRLRDIALEQLYWTVGKNPFAQSLIYGEGYNYPQLNSFSSGEIAGYIPVGIRSLGNTDIPYWPQINNACYKEVWVTSAGKFLSLLAEIQ